MSYFALFKADDCFALLCNGIFKFTAIFPNPRFRVIRWIHDEIAKEESEKEELLQQYELKEIKINQDLNRIFADYEYGEVKFECGRVEYKYLLGRYLLDVPLNEAFERDLSERHGLKINTRRIPESHIELHTSPINDYVLFHNWVTRTSATSYNFKDGRYPAIYVGPACVGFMFGGEAVILGHVFSTNAQVKVDEESKKTIIHSHYCSTYMEGTYSSRLDRPLFKIFPKSAFDVTLYEVMPTFSCGNTQKSISIPTAAVIKSKNIVYFPSFHLVPANVQFEDEHVKISADQVWTFEKSFQKCHLKFFIENIEPSAIREMEDDSALALVGGAIMAGNSLEFYDVGVYPRVTLRKIAVGLFAGRYLFEGSKDEHVAAIMDISNLIPKDIAKYITTFLWTAEFQELKNQEHLIEDLDDRLDGTCSIQNIFDQFD
jgi:hypothetical protein